jgi:hypothetical protein
MYSYLIEYNGKIIGTYTNFYTAKSFIISCLQNNFMHESAQIHIMKQNSCFKIKTKTISIESYDKKIIKKMPNIDEFNETNTFSNSSQNSKKSQLTQLSLSYESSSNTSVTSKSTLSNSNHKQVTSKLNSIDNSDPEILEIAKQKIDLQHKINILKKQKEKIEESKNVFETDLKLFNMFKQSKKLNNTFEIPELFAEKYKIMEKLAVDNSLTWENFYKTFNETFKHNNNYIDYFASNDYENIFVNNPELNNNSEDIINEEFIVNTDSD